MKPDRDLRWCPFCEMYHDHSDAKSAKREGYPGQMKCFKKSIAYAERNCRNGKCLRTHIGLKAGDNWHEMPCIECAINPYNGGVELEKIHGDIEAQRAQETEK